MSYQNESFGMMDAGYFVPRGDILNWINNLLKLNISKIQQLGSGAVYCQIVDVIHPGKVALSKINWKAKSDYQFINNLKLLQNAFDKIGIKKHVEVQKLAKAKYQDNLEFVQWLKRYYDLNCGERGNNYNAQQKRGSSAIDMSFAEKNVVPKTYTASGTVKTINQKPQKVQKPQKTQRTKQVSSTNLNTKIEEGPKQVKSPAKPQLKQVDGKKNEPKAVKTESREVQQKSEPVKEIVREKQIIIQYQTDPQLEAQLEKAFGDLEEAKEQLAGKDKKLHQAEMKLLMIKEILESEDDPTMKISLIQEIYKE